MCFFLRYDPTIEANSGMLNRRADAEGSMVSEGRHS